MSAHGAVGGRIVGDGNTSTEQQADRPDLGDPAADPIGTWRIEPWESEGPEPWRRQYDIVTARRAIKLNREWWALTTLDPTCRPLTFRNCDLRDWPYTSHVVVGAAIRRQRTIEQGEPERVLASAPIVEGEDVEFPFRTPKGK